MKKAIHSVKIGLVQRISASAHPNDYELTSDIEPSSIHQSTRKQALGRRISKSAISQLEFNQKKHISTLETHKDVRLNYIAETSNENQHHSKISSSSSPPLSPHLQKNIKPTQEQSVITSSLYQIPTTSKWSTWKKVLVGISTFLAIATLITVATVLTVLLTKPKDASTTTTTASTVNVSAYWSFDNTLVDSYGIYNGQPINSPTYASSTNLPYVGHGQALYFNSASNQSVLVSTSYFNLSYTSFTIESWIYLASLTNDRGIFGQCQCSTCSNQCLFFIIRNNRLYIDFTSNYLTGSTAISTGYWYHIAFVYSYDTRQQILYLNGVQDAIKSNAQPYQGQNGSIQIGSTQAYSTMNFFYGYIDNVALTTRAKSSVEILRDASLMAYYSFDLPNPNTDSGTNGLDGTSNNIVSATGRVNEAMRFLGSSSSYFRAYGFYQLPYGVVNAKPFSIAMWINPSSISNIAIIQMFWSLGSTSNCDILLGISSSNLFTGQIFVHNTGSTAYLTGPFVTQNTWTHVSLTYSTGNGYTLYINGVLFGSTGTVSYSSINSFANLCIGYPNTCSSSSVNGYYQGYLDELYIYNRELSQSDVTSLANP
ncbi:unnamed protein product [Rotaria sp. Silwood1]|nr:unnamed protein product [Rotaria sp. Silwood1]CAF1678532.1 unnamed protein product [Rotaria sp. Silwood1]CAF3964345.1 unnamed protein product [Rotaria sp. Silwood1]CAF4980905.1 unnamed protein product [Rotaria sp. Silwood1]